MAGNRAALAISLLLVALPAPAAPQSPLSLLSPLALLLPHAARAYDAVGWQMESALPERDTDMYLEMIRTDYKWRIQDDYVQYSIDMLVDPCRDETKAGGIGDQCCFDTNVQGCQTDHVTVEAGSDLLIAYFQNAHIASCIGTVFENDPNCGTYIEVHRFNNREVLADQIISSTEVASGYRTVRVATHRLCMGWHELWWVVRTRSGPYVQKTRMFYVSRPTCQAPNGSARAPESRLAPPAIP